MNIRSILIISIIISCCLFGSCIASTFEKRIQENDDLTILDSKLVQNFLKQKGDDSSDCNNSELTNHRLNLINIIFFIVFGIFALIGTIVLIFIFIKVPQSREEPGTIIFCIAIADTILSTHWVCFGLFNLVMDRSPCNDSFFCQFQSIFGIIGGFLDGVYNLIFCLFLLYWIKKRLQTFQFPTQALALVVFTLSIGISVFLYIQKQTGINLFGTCSFKVNNSYPLGGLAIMIFFLVVNWGTVVYFNSRTPEMGHAQAEYTKARGQFLSFFLPFLIVSSILWFLVGLTNFLSGIYYRNNNIHNDNFSLIITIGNISQIFIPFCFSLFRIRDPWIRSYVIKFQFIRILYRLKPLYSSTLSETLITDDDEKNRYSGFSMEPSSNMRHTNSSKKSTGNYFQTIAQNLLSMEIYTIVAGILVADKRLRENQSYASQLEITKVEGEFEIWENSSSLHTFDKECTIPISDEIITEELGIQHRNSFKNLQLNSFKCLCKVYHEPSFQILRIRDQIHLDISKSLDIFQNLQDLHERIGSNGGRSGAFFFFSRDQKLILKEITAEELEVFINMIERYVKYMVKENSHSLIATIYGAYTFTRTDPEEVKHFILMRNISGIPRDYVLRVYDMKGSEYNREVCTNQVMNRIPSTDSAQLEQFLRNQTLKDIDFHKFEQTILISQTVKGVIKDSLIKDSQFFRDLKLMDYSLIVFKLDIKNYCLHNNLTIENYMNSQQNQFFSVRSTTEPDIFYNIAIIDYFQKWNFSKKLEQQLQNLQTDKMLSAQEPNTYSQVFIDNLVNQVF